MSKSIEGAIECPFYLEEGKSFIKCEGVLNGTICTHSFNNDKDKHNYETWVSIATTYLRIGYTNIGKSFNQYDSVTISGCENNDINNTFVIWDKGDDYIVISGILTENFTQLTPLSIERKVPEMDFFCENVPYLHQFLNLRL